MIKESFPKKYIEDDILIIQITKIERKNKYADIWN